MSECSDDLLQLQHEGLGLCEDLSSFTLCKFANQNLGTEGPQESSASAKLESQTAACFVGQCQNRCSRGSCVGAEQVAWTHTI